jgi:hypothetical protein
MSAQAPAAVSDVWGKSSQDAPPQSVLHTGTREVQLDVVVVDGKGNPVKGLKKDDFVLSSD